TFSRTTGSGEREQPRLNAAVSQGQPRDEFRQPIERWEAEQLTCPFRKTDRRGHWRDAEARALPAREPVCGTGTAAQVRVLPFGPVCSQSAGVHGQNTDSRRR